MLFDKAIQQISYPTSSHNDKDPYPKKAMAADFAMPVQQFTASPSQYTLYNSQSQPISPVNSATATPNNASPTSPRTNPPPYLPAHTTRQLRPPKSPLYVPAVLRPTDPPRRVMRQSPLTPPQSKDNSYDDLDNARTLSRRSTDSGKFGVGAVQEAEWSEEESMADFPKVTGLPSRGHWKPDVESIFCDETTCSRYFGWYTRRHHCRRCGNIFCDTHSPYLIPLDQDANYHPKGTTVRACHHCYEDFHKWRIARSSRSNSESSELGQEPSTPTVNCAGRGKGVNDVFSKNQGHPESLAASVPNNWHWSTF